MSQPVTIILLGEPVPWSRTNRGFGGRTGGKPSTFTPAKQRNTAAALKIAAQMEVLQASGNVILDEPLSFDLTAEFGIPASWSQRKRAAAIAGEIRPGKKPDIDNLYKLASFVAANPALARFAPRPLPRTPALEEAEQAVAADERRRS